MSSFRGSAASSCGADSPRRVSRRSSAAPARRLERVGACMIASPCLFSTGRVFAIRWSSETNLDLKCGIHRVGLDLRHLGLRGDERGRERASGYGSCYGLSPIGRTILPPFGVLTVSSSAGRRPHARSSSVDGTGACGCRRSCGAGSDRRRSSDRPRPSRCRPCRRRQRRGGNDRCGHRALLMNGSTLPCRGAPGGPPTSRGPGRRSRSRRRAEQRPVPPGGITPSPPRAP